MNIDTNDVIVGKRIFTTFFNEDASVNRIDSTDTIYESYESAYEDVYNPIKIVYGGITNDTVVDEYKGIITFKYDEKDIDNRGHSLIITIYRYNKPIARYAILSIIVNKLRFMMYRGMFIKPFDIDKFLIVRKDNRELTVKKSLDLALTYIDTYLLINPEWQ